MSRLQAVVEFLKDSSGSEALGIGHAAALLRAAPASQVGPELFDALGTLADRLARRATSNRTNDAALAAHLDVAASYGVKLVSFEREGRTRVCYDGEAFRRVLALGGSPEARVRAALALTRPECIDPAMDPVELQALNEWRSSVLEQVDAVAPAATEPVLGYVELAGFSPDGSRSSARRSCRRRAPSASRTSAPSSGGAPPTGAAAPWPCADGVRSSPSGM